MRENSNVNGQNVMGKTHGSCIHYDSDLDTWLSMPNYKEGWDFKSSDMSALAGMPFNPKQWR